MKGSGNAHSKKPSDIKGDVTPPLTKPKQVTFNPETTKPGVDHTNNNIGKKQSNKPMRKRNNQVAVTGYENRKAAEAERNFMRDYRNGIVDANGDIIIKTGKTGGNRRTRRSI